MANPIHIWEKKLLDPSETPMFLPLEFLKEITCDFSTERELGRGGYGVVYKGVLNSGKIIAVKKIHEIHLIEDNIFRNEISSLMGIKHQNIVQFVGYCAESTWEVMKLQGSGNYIFAEIPKRLLCFEYVCNASLDKYISDESSGLEWNMRYEIIKGICGGLHYLHEQCRIIHLDLKPQNILLDATMVPKIVDFGLSRIFGEGQSRIITENRAGSRGYMAPEYLIQGVVSIKADIFSLGVLIIEIVTGRRDYPLSVVPYFQHFNENDSPQSTDTSNQRFIEKILRIWRNKLQKSEGDTVKLEQIRVCAELGIQCTEFYPGNRPVTQHIIDRLDEVNIMDGTMKTGMSSTWAVAQVCSLMSQNMIQDQVPAVSIPASKTNNPSKDNSTSPVIPDAFCCPISLALMEDPVMLTTGQTYDRRNITIWLNAGHDTCPRTEQKLVNKSLTPNHALHRRIAQWCEANGLEQPKLRSNASAAAPYTSSEHDIVSELLQKLKKKGQTQCIEAPTQGGVWELLQKLPSQNVLDQRGAAGTLLELVKRNAENRACIGDSGGIPILDSLGDTTQPGDIYFIPNHQQATPSRNEPSSSYNMEPNRNTFAQNAQDPNDRHAEQMYHESTFNQDIVSATPSNYFQEAAGPREARLDDDSQFYRNDNHEYSADGDPLPGIEGFQIVGEPRPGSTLTACGFPTNGTTLCNFQWVRCLEDGTRQSIEGATMYDYVVTADDVGTLLAVDCTPMDYNGRQGDLVRKFANGENRISCDPDMQNDINRCISRGRADFDVYVLQGYSPDEWEHATLVLGRTGYQINLSQKDEVFIDEKYSPILQTKIPNGRTTRFVLVSSGGVKLPFNTQGITEPNNEDNDFRLRDLIVLVMRIFQNKAVDAKRKGKA